FTAGTHPDLLQVAKEVDATQIKVDQIRALIDFMNLSRQSAPQKVALVFDAELMNPSAANSLLKTLEEPPGSALLVLVSSRAQMLPATISSRCQALRFRAPPRDQADAWLREQLPDADTGLLLTLAQGRPLAALALATSGEAELREQIFAGLKDLLGDQVGAPALAARWQDLDSEPLMRWLVSWLQDAVRVHFGGPSEQLDNPDYGKHLHTLAKRLDLAAVFALLEESLQVRRLATTTTVNRQLLLEDLMLAWQQRIR
ncbi:MAG: DNA polymerase III subunit delta' C-terminal domain-containing protein, partial [Gammaproteobacteria bacterium]